MLRDNWRSVCLADICSQITDGKHGDCEDHPGSGYFFLSCKDVLDGTLLYENARQITKTDFLDTHKRTNLEPNDLLVTNSGTIGRMALAPDNPLTSRTTFQKSVAIIKPRPEMVDPQFLYYALRAEARRLIERAGGTAQKNLLLRDLRAFDLRLPSLAQQRLIAHELYRYDELIRCNQRRIEVLEQMARAVYREWFVDLRFPGYESCNVVGSRLGAIPETWQIRPVSDVVKRLPVGKRFDQKSVMPSGTIPVLDQGKSGIIGFHDGAPGVAASAEQPVIVFANHTCYQRLIQFPFSTIQNVLPFTPSDSLYRDIYWLHCATNGLVTFNDYKGHWPEFVAKELIVPSAPLCSEFGRITSPLFRQIHLLSETVRKLRCTRDLLLPRVLSGQMQLDAV